MTKPAPSVQSSRDRSHSLSTWRTCKAHVRIARLDHWIKNLFVLPGVVIAVSLNRLPLTWDLLEKTLLGLLAVGLIASSNYVINEICDAPFDKFHPIKRYRPIPSGVADLALVGWDMAALLVMGCAYNLRPFRTKDVPYLDVVSEAINNPIRLAAGWLIVSPTIPPASLLLSYWLVGCYFMALKRYAEQRHLRESDSVAKYRKSLAFLTPETLAHLGGFLRCLCHAVFRSIPDALP